MRLLTPDSFQDWLSHLPARRIPRMADWLRTLSKDPVKRDVHDNWVREGWGIDHTDKWHHLPEVLSLYWRFEAYNPPRTVADANAVLLQARRLSAALTCEAFERWLGRFPLGLWLGRTGSSLENPFAFYLTDVMVYILCRPQTFMQSRL